MTNRESSVIYAQQLQQSSLAKRAFRRQQRKLHVEKRAFYLFKSCTYCPSSDITAMSSP